MIVKFVKERETKRMIRFKEVNDEGNEPESATIGTIYLRKTVAGSRESIEIEIKGVD